MNDQLKIWIKENLLDSLGKISPRKLFRFPDRKIQIFELTSFLPETASLSQRCWHIINDNFDIMLCCICNQKKVKYVNLREGYKRHCSQKCSMKNPEVIKKFNNSMVEKYGVPWSMQSKELLDKSEKTCLEKYGVPHYTQTETHIESIKERYRNETPIERKERFDKNRETCLEKYGVDWFSKTDIYKNACKETWQNNYGVDHPSQSSIVFERTQGGYKKSWHEYVLPSGKIINLQGYEPEVFDELLKIYNENEIVYKKREIPPFWYIGIDMKKHRYFPDFYIPKDNLIVEVKSTFTYNKELQKNLLKEQSVKNAGFDYKLWIWI